MKWILLVVYTLAYALALAVGIQIGIIVCNKHHRLREVPHQPMGPIIWVKQGETDAERRA